LVLDWEDIVRLSIKLGRKISKSNFKADAIVAILRGGLVPARILSDYLNITKMYAMGVSFYTDLAKHKSEPIITQPLHARFDKKKILLVDDVADTGLSLIVAREHIFSLGAEDVKVATLHKKPWSKITPDFYVEDTDAWIIYPWEYIESLESLRNKLLSSEVSEDDRKIVKKTLEHVEKLMKKYL